MPDASSFGKLALTCAACSTFNTRTRARHSNRSVDVLLNKMATREKRTEVVAEWCQEADFSEQGVIKDVLLCGNKSRNGYGIPAKAFGSEDRTKELYEGKMIFFNHDTQRPTARDVHMSFAGVVRNVRLKDGRPRGDIDTRRAPAGNALWEISQISPPPAGLGLSHTAQYRFDAKRESVEEVAQVVSVDVVMMPATTKTFYESTNVDFETELKIVRDERTKLQGDLKDAQTKVTVLESSEKDLKDQVAKLTAEKAVLSEESSALKLKVDDFESQVALAKRREEVNAEIKAAGLNSEDTVLVSTLFIETLVGTPDAAVRAKLIEDRAGLVQRSESAPGAFERKPKDSSDVKPFNAETYFAQINL